MTGISLHMQWPLTYQLHGRVSQREQSMFFVYSQSSLSKDRRLDPRHGGNIFDSKSELAHIKLGSTIFCPSPQCRTIGCRNLKHRHENVDIAD
jgi:hypothetical protein